MKYNPLIHHRRSIRLKGYDYSQSGLYFLTICVQHKACLFGEITDGELFLNDAGRIVESCWLEIPQHYPDVVLHEYVVMPNHIHGIIEITYNENDVLPTVEIPNTQSVGAKNLSPFENNVQTLTMTDDFSQNSMRSIDFSPLRRPKCKSRSIGAIVRGFKIGVTKQMGYSVWQRNYHEHIIRNNDMYQYIANYIINNPLKWGNDRFYV